MFHCCFCLAGTSYHQTYDNSGGEVVVVALLTTGSLGYGVLGTKFNDIEFAQCLVFFGVKPSPIKTWPR